MRTSSFVFFAFIAFVGTASMAKSAWAVDGIPDCEDGIDNDNDGLVDFPADPQCKSPDWPSESPTPALADSGINPDAGAGRVDAGGRVDGGGSLIDTGVVNPYDGGPMFDHPDGGSGNPPPSTGGGTSTAPNEVTNPQRSSGCSLSASGDMPALPILLLLAVGCGLALLSRRPTT